MRKKAKPPVQKPEEDKSTLSDYRQWLVEAEHKSQEAFDKAILSLSGGALGISFVFLKDVVGTRPVVDPQYLLAAWFFWASSSLAILSSYLLSQKALRVAIAQVDAGSIRKERPGGLFAAFTAHLNTAGAVMFFLGVCSIAGFVNGNLSTKGVKDVTEKAAISPSASIRSPASSTGATASGQGGNSLPGTTSNGGVSAAAPATNKGVSP